MLLPDDDRGAPPGTVSMVKVVPAQSVIADCAAVPAEFCGMETILSITLSATVAAVVSNFDRLLLAAATERNAIPANSPAAMTPMAASSSPRGKPREVHLCPEGAGEDDGPVFLLSSSPGLARQRPT